MIACDGLNSRIRQRYADVGREYARLEPAAKLCEQWRRSHGDVEGAQDQFAKASGLGLSAAKSRLQRARQRLKTRMTQACQVRLDEAGHVTDFVPRP